MECVEHRNVGDGICTHRLRFVVYALHATRFTWQKEQKVRTHEDHIEPEMLVDKGLNSGLVF